MTRPTLREIPVYRWRGRNGEMPSAKLLGRSDDRAARLGDVEQLLIIVMPDGSQFAIDVQHVRPIGEEYRQTLELLRERGPIHGAALARLDGCEPTAMNNRLAALEQQGLATSQRHGRRRVYTATN